MLPRNPHTRRLVIASALLVFSMACLCIPTSFLTTPTVPPTQIQPPASPVIPQQTRTPLNPPVPTPTGTSASFPGQELNADGPWLLIEANQGLWAVNPDGTDTTGLTSVDYWHGRLSQAVQPGGDEVVYISPADFSFQHLTLNGLVVSQGSGKNDWQIELTSAATEAYAASGPGDPGFEALRAIGEQQSFAWSPDGTKLAFVGAMDGPSADVYIYDATTTKITRVSSDPDQDFSPSWSPDGQHLLYLEAKGFGTGAGMSMSAVWVASGDGSNAVKLYDTDSAGEEVRGWLDNTTALIDTWNVVCGPGNLRLYDVTSRDQTVLQKDCVSSATASGWRGLGLYSDKTGIYMISAEDRTPRKVDDHADAMIKPWGPDDQAFTVRFQDASLATFGMSEFDHQVSPITAPPDASMLPFEQTDVAMYGAIWGWTSRIPAQEGVWITGPGLEIGQVFDRAARFPAWSPANNLLFFAPLEGGYDLYTTTFGSHYTDLHVVNHLDADINGVVWLGEK
jgi:hypothetical protein